MDRKKIRIFNIAILLSILFLVGATLLSLFNIYMVASSARLSDIQGDYSRGALTISTTFTASNPGPFPLEVLFTTEFNDSFGNALTTTPISIMLPSGVINYSRPIEIQIKLSQIGEEKILELVQNSGQITVRSKLSSSLGNILLLDVDLEGVLNWNPPIYNLQVDSAKITSFNSTHIVITSGYSFENLSTFFDASGDVEVKVYDEDGQLVGLNRLHIDAKPTSNSSDEVNVSVKLPADTDYMLFNDVKMNYTAVGVLSSDVIGSNLLNVTRQFYVDWGAPVKNPSLSQFTYTSLNSTHSIMITRLSSENYNDYLTLEGQIRAVLLSGTNIISSSDYQPFTAKPKTFNSWNFEIVVPNEALLLDTPVLRIELQTTYREFVWEMNYLD